MMIVSPARIQYGVAAPETEAAIQMQMLLAR
jgi:hypothetical protein